MLLTGRLLVVVLLAAPAVLSAHHGIINFDMNREVEVTGTVARLAFVNPHSWLYVDVTGGDGRVTAWKCELRGATVLRRSGWSPEMFAPGTRITITGAPDRFEPNTCYVGTIVLGDGTRIDRYGQIRRAAAPPAPVERPLRLANGRPNLAGEWAAEQRVLTDPRGISGAFLPLSVASRLEPGAVPKGTQAFPGTRGSDAAKAEDPVETFWNRRPSAVPLTAAGARAIEGFDGSSTDNPRLRCEPTNILFDWTFEADVNRIIQHDDRITLLYGSMGLERIIHLDREAHPANLAPSRAGHSIGRWEGDVLVVETVGFTPGILSADGRVPHSDALHVIERFELSHDGQAIRRSWVAADPRYFTGQYKGADTVFVSDVPYEPTPCDDRSFKSAKPTPASRWWVGGAAAALVGGAGWWAWTRRRREGVGRH